MILINKKLNNLESIVDQINKIKIKKKIFLNIKFQLNSKTYNIKPINSFILYRLFAFYKKFSKKEREYFGYPLFKPTNIKFIKFKEKYKEYLLEKKFWHYFILYHNKKIIGLSYIKKIGFKNKKKEKNKSPTIGGPFLLKKFRKRNLGFILLMVCIFQAKILKLPFLYSRVVTTNYSAIRNAEKCGFVKTGEKFFINKKNYDFEYKIKL
jgi:hypothetical protein